MLCYGLDMVLFPLKMNLVATLAVHTIEIFERQSIRELIIHISGKWIVHLWTL